MCLAKETLSFIGECGLYQHISRIRFLPDLSNYDWLPFSESWACPCPCASKNPYIMKQPYVWVLQFWHGNWWLQFVQWCRNSWTAAIAFCYSEKNKKKETKNPNTNSTNLHLFYFYFCKSGEHMAYLTLDFVFLPVLSFILLTHILACFTKEVK